MDERAIYQDAAIEALRTSGLNLRMMSPAEMAKIGADGAVVADRKRMAEQLRNRTLFQANARGVTNPIGMKVDELMFMLADQIEQGMPFDATGNFSNEPPAIDQ